LKEQWCITEEASADFVCAMEDVLEVYHRPHDPARPVVCFDEGSKQQMKERRLPLPPQPGNVAEYDYCTSSDSMRHWTLPPLVDMEIRYMFTKMEDYNG
jgi:hypothetical protein